MNLIRNIHIRYFRSIHRMDINCDKDLIILSGLNDVGKSNILKALNLFFNDQVNNYEEINFTNDFSLRRMSEVRRESIKGKQFIKIDIDFNCPKNYINSLPPTFTISKTWFRDSRVPQVGNNLEILFKRNKIKGSIENARRMLTQLSNRIKFTYIPAIRDKQVFDSVLLQLQETLFETEFKTSDQIFSEIGKINKNLTDRAVSLRNEFFLATRINANISLPADPNSLFKSFGISTEWRNPLPKNGGTESFPLMLHLRGDGIQARYIPSILNYISSHSSLFHIWGFEEPENSIEYSLARNLAEAFDKDYKRFAQIIVTSHSPAFITLKTPGTMCYRVFNTSNKTEAAQIYPKIDEKNWSRLNTDLGLFYLDQKIYEEFINKFKENEDLQSKVNSLNDELANSTKPLVLVEGKTDVIILNTAWRKLHGTHSMPFVIKCCDPLNVTTGGSGGASTLKNFLSSVPHDSKQIVCGLFDYDREGKKNFDELPKQFRNVTDSQVKICENNKSSAILLPIPPGRDDYARYFNLYIEYYFRDDLLILKDENNHGLEFKHSENTIVNNGVVIRKEVSTEPYMRNIKNGKTVFAEKIVINYDPLEFENFRLIFNKISDVITAMTMPNDPIL